VIQVRFVHCNFKAKRSSFKIQLCGITGLLGGSLLHCWKSLESSSGRSFAGKIGEFAHCFQDSMQEYGKSKRTKGYQA
jgi:hypothetical protein